MLSDLVGLIISVSPILGLLLWREQADRRQRAAAIVRADVHAGATRALEGESLLAINVNAPTAWWPGRVRLSTPTGYEPLIGRAFQTVLERVPAGYEVVIHCGGNS
jgi:hypothetical protein